MLLIKWCQNWPLLITLKMQKNTCQNRKWQQPRNPLGCWSWEHHERQIYLLLRSGRCQQRLDRAVGRMEWKPTRTLCWWRNWRSFELEIERWSRVWMFLRKSGVISPTFYKQLFCQFPFAKWQTVSTEKLWIILLHKTLLFKWWWNRNQSGIVSQNIAEETRLLDVYLIF